MTEEKKHEFAFEKKLGIAECACGDMPSMIRAISLLLQCIKETNQLHGAECEFFRLDFRQLYFDEILSNRFPHGSLLLDLKWGSKQELKDREEK